VPLTGGGARFPSHNIVWTTSVPNGILIHSAVWPQYMAEMWGLLCPPPFFWGGGPGSPSNIMWPWSRPTSVPSFILIHSTVWTQGHNTPTLQTGQDRQTDRQRSDGIGRTVLQKVAQNGTSSCRRTLALQIHFTNTAVVFEHL